MNSFVRAAPILVALLFYIPLFEVSGILKSAISEVMPFREVWSQSLCRSLERMVEVEQEHPGGVEHIFRPGCVPLQRCSGCCSDEKLQCTPTLTHNITMQLVRINPAERTKHYVQLSFLEHHACECRLKRNHRTYHRGQRLRNPYERRKKIKGRRSINCGKCQHHFG